MTPQDRDKLRDLAGKATPGPWGIGPEARHGVAYPIRSSEHGLIAQSITQTGPFNAAANAAYIAAASPSVVLALLDRIDALEAGLKESEASVIRDAYRAQQPGWHPAEADRLSRLPERIRALLTPSKEDR